jgi:hypothetical protein
MEHPQIAGTALGTKDFKREEDDKVATIEAFKSNRIMTDDNQANQLSAFSKVQS